MISQVEGWIWPVEAHPVSHRPPVVSDGFDAHSRGGRGHYGVDILYRRDVRGERRYPQFTPLFTMPDGVHALAAGPGRVHRADQGDRHGGVVGIDHGRVGGVHLQTIYRHLARIDVAVGDPVSAGTMIGIVGYDRTMSPNQTPNHLHFEVWDPGRQKSAGDPRKGWAIDPAPFLDGAAVITRSGTLKQPAPDDGVREPTKQDPRVSDEELLAEAAQAEEDATVVATAVAGGIWWLS